MAQPNKKRLPVCINVFPTLDYIEIVQLNDDTRDIQVTAAVPCSFDPITRQIGNIELFAQSVRDIFTTNRIPFNTPVILILPSLLTREFDVPADMSRDEVMMMATSEAERFNIFKNLETHVDLLKLSSSLYIYSAYPKQEIEKFSMAFSELKIPLKSIEINYFSILRGLLATGTISEEVEKNEPWSLMVVGEGTFFLAILEGIQILTTSETLLSQNIDTNELLQEIKDDYDSFTRHHPFEKLVIINNNNKIHTESILDSLNPSIPVANIDQKPANLVSRGGVEATLPCTLEAIGGVFSNDLKEMPTLDLRLRGATLAGIDELRNRAFYIGMAVCGAAFIGCLFLWGILALIIHLKTEDINAVAAADKNSPIQSLGALNEVQQKLFVKKAYNQNIALNNTLISIGKNIGPDIWLEELTVVNPLTESSTIENIPIDMRIKGNAMSTDSINQLTSNMKSALKRNDLQVPSIESKKQGDETFWSWVIASKNLAGTDGNNNRPNP